VSGFKTEHKRIITSQHNPDDTALLIEADKCRALMNELGKYAPVYGVAYAVSRWAGLRPAIRMGTRSRRKVGGTPYSNYQNGMWVPVEAVIG
jgi:hypothetical protein